MNPQRHVRRFLLVATVVVAGSLAGVPMPAAADHGPVGGVEEVAELGENESVVTNSNATTLVFDRNSATARVNVFSGQRVALTLPAGFEDVRTISEDGTTLIATSQSEAIGGDADGGLHDVYLHDLTNGTTTPASETIAGSSHLLLAASADASTVLFSSVASADTDDVAIWAWRNGVVTELTALANIASASDLLYDRSLRVSDDGSTVTGSRRVGPTQVAFHLDLDTDALTERVVRGSADVGHVSNDGELVAWIEYGINVDDYRTEADLVVWRPDGDTIERHPLAAASYDASMVLSGDGSTAFLTRFTDTTFAERSLIAIETADGSAHEVYTSSTTNVGFNQLLAADQTGARLAFTSYSESFDIDGSYRFRQTISVWDESGSPAASSTSPVLADQIERLYRAYFGRAPDTAGLNYWIDQRAERMSLAAISEAFASSPEFTSTYGALDDGSFVDLVYSNVLGRSPDADGRAFWVGQLAGGVSRGSVMVGFSESTEFAAATNTSAPMSVNEARIRRLYEALFGEAPSQDEADAWVAQLEAGVPISSIAGALAQTPEFADLRNANEASVVDYVFVTRLGTAADDSAYLLLDAWFQRVFEGTFDLVQFMLDVADHPEFVRRTGLPVN